MTVPNETEAAIVRLFLVERWKVGSIATQLGVHHTTVTRVLDTLGVPRPNVASRPSIADLYIPLIEETLDRYPTVPASRLFQMVKERGYSGTSDGHFRRIVAKHRPRRLAQPEAYLRLRTLSGEQGQVDWAASARSRSAARSAS